MKKRIISLILSITMMLSVIANLPLTSWLINTDNDVNAYYAVVIYEGTEDEFTIYYCDYHNTQLNSDYSCKYCKNHQCPVCLGYEDEYGICTNCQLGRPYYNSPFSESYYCDATYTYDPATKTLIIGNEKVKGTENTSGRYGYINNYTFSPLGYREQKIANEVESVVITNCLYIGIGAFQNCPNLKSVAIAGYFDTNNIIVSKKAFKGCPNLSTVMLSSSITAFEEGVFADCPKLESIKYEGDIKSIEKEAFKGCTSFSLKNLKISDDTTIAEGAFSGITVNNLDFDRTTAINLSKTGIVAADKVTIGPNTKTIPSNSFSGTSINSLTISEGVETIGANAFENTKINSINLPKSLTKIDKESFLGTSIESITIPHSVNEIGISALGGIKEITIPCSTDLAYGFSNRLKCDAGVITASDHDHPIVDKTTIYVAPDSYQEAYFREYYKNEVEDGTITLNTTLTHYGVWNTEIPATCNANGTESMVCTDCGKKTTREIPTLPHTEVIDNAVAATTTKTGLTEGSHCSVCGTVIKAQEVVPTLTPVPTAKPTTKPTVAPTKAPVANPTANPTKAPATTVTPDTKPTTAPSGNTTPDAKPTASPADKPTAEPTAEPTKAPSVEDFAERLYTTCLGRDAEEDGKAYWTSELKSGKTGAAVAEGFFFSPEYEGRKLDNKDFIGTLYETFMGRTPADEEVAYWSSEMDNGKTRKDIFDGFVNSVEWANICLTYGIRSGGLAAPTFEKEASDAVKAFAERLYTTCLGREAEKEGLEWWAAELANLRQTGTVAASGFFNSPEFIGLKTDDNEYVTRLYKTFMGRDPEEAGFEFWTSELKSGKDRQYVFDGFSVAPEFANLCAEAGIMR